ncbi:MAG: hypothetical protein ACYSTQ_10275 [Planctomycetota bacterium]|jgi:hypothetical protein
MIDKQHANVHASYLENHVESLIRLKNDGDVIQKRNAVIQYIWKQAGFPTSKMPAKTQTDIHDERYSDLTNLQRIDKFVVSMDYGFDSVVYLFHAADSNRKLVIYHQGHAGDFIKGKNIIRFFLSRHYSVMAFSMPMTGMNSQPVVEVKDFGKLQFINHNQLTFLESDRFTPIRLFVEPVVVCLNYVQEKYSFASIAMIGLSGGGWTTTLLGAIDPRIAKSYPVAGTLPIYLRFQSMRDFGDYEQNWPPLYRIANYLDLYILASYGAERTHLQVLNKYDSCCHGGVGYRTYEKEVKRIVERLGVGRFEIYLDDSHREHKISGNALRVILDDLKSVESGSRTERSR